MPPPKPGRTIEFPLRGAGGEPVDLQRTILSHGVASLPPMRVDDAGRWFEVTLRLGGRPRTLHVREARPGFGVVEVKGRVPSRAGSADALGQVAHILRLDADLSGFYERAAGDPELAWVASGAGRMIRSATVFEEVVKTVCTTNCTWSATERMVGALVEHLGEKAPGAPRSGPVGRAFPTPAAMAEVDEGFYREVVRAGYRGAYLRTLAAGVVDGSLDLEALGSSAGELSDDEVEATLLTLPGVGPYAAAHIMMMLGRYSRLILDSWTRPTYARLVRRKQVTDEGIRRRFRRYGPYAGLAFWLFLTRGWVEERA